jgi:Zn-dependent M28 family amino/carboxypeptidase
MELEVKNATGDDEGDCYNVIANIPGAGPHKDEIVMVGGHLDSWQGGTGATDNGVGSAVMLEVIRVLKALNLKLDRTVRIGLWGGEEEGLFGSREYVKKTFADPTKMETTPEWDKFSAYYNVDNGSGKIRGVYLQGNEMVRPFFEAMLAPFKDMGVSAITIRNTGGTDHQSFDAVGLPGFQFIQDPLEYGTRTHHSNMDVYDRVVRGDLMQMSVVVSSLVYHTANREQKLPRKPKPAARPATPPMF